MRRSRSNVLRKCKQDSHLQEMIRGSSIQNPSCINILIAVFVWAWSLPWWITWVTQRERRTVIGNRADHRDMRLEIQFKIIAPIMQSLFEIDNIFRFHAWEDKKWETDFRGRKECNGAQHLPCVAISSHIVRSWSKAVAPSEEKLSNPARLLRVDAVHFWRIANNDDDASGLNSSSSIVSSQKERYWATILVGIIFRITSGTTIFSPLLSFSFRSPNGISVVMWGDWMKAMKCASWLSVYRFIGLRSISGVVPRPAQGKALASRSCHDDL